MKIDYDFIKEILLIMEDYKEHEINNISLLEKLGKQNEDKFIGHIKLLGDNNFIDYDINTTQCEYGFKSFPGVSGYKILDTNYRITAQGYEFLDILKNNTVLNKLRDFTISNVLYIGREIIIRTAVSSITGR